MSNQLGGGVLLLLRDHTENTDQNSVVYLWSWPGLSRKLTLTLGFECKHFIWQGIPRSGERNRKEGCPYRCISR